MKKAYSKIEFFVFLTIIVVSFTLDQLSKNIATKYLQGVPEQDYLWGLIRLMYSENTGAWGGFGQNWPPAIKLTVLTVLPLLVLGFLVYQMWKTDRPSKLNSWGFGLIIGGGLGNLVDRIRFGSVVDFLYMGKHPIDTNIFNIADVCIMAGVGLVVIYEIKQSRLNKQQRSKNQD